MSLWVSWVLLQRGPESGLLDWTGPCCCRLLMVGRSWGRLCWDGTAGTAQLCSRRPRPQPRARQPFFVKGQAVSTASVLAAQLSRHSVKAAVDSTGRLMRWYVVGVSVVQSSLRTLLHSRLHLQGGNRTYSLWHRKHRSVVSCSPPPRQAQLHAEPDPVLAGLPTNQSLRTDTRKQLRMVEKRRFGRKETPLVNSVQLTKDWRSVFHVLLCAGLCLRRRAGPSWEPSSKRAENI